MDSTDNWLPRASSLSSIDSYTEIVCFTFYCQEEELRVAPNKYRLSIA